MLLALILSLAGAAWAAPAKSAQAAEFYARILSVSGDVTIKALGHGAFVKAQRGATLISGDWIKTGEAAVAQLELDGGATLLVAGGSTLVLGGEAEDPNVEFKAGEWLLGLVKRLRAGRRMRVSTPQAVAAVRGTLFWGKTDAKETLLAGLESQVEITAQGKTVTLKPDQLVRVPSGAAPQDPVAHKVPAVFLDRFKVGGSLGGIEPLLTPGTRKKKINKIK
ncbi:MAG: FecR domain-containing protein [Elusimicrobia bacterium]|nr:FecR domain-containing protein [Elusimicrobiota bacterium]